MFIVIEGLDGAGKSTQVNRIREELRKRRIESEYLHFPRFDAPLYGNLIARFLRGELGGLDDVNPYLVALLYAGDRKEASERIARWVAEGKYVIADRYVYSNVAYQCAKIADPQEREQLRRWIMETEYTHNGIIRPDKSLFLDVPFAFTKRKLEEARTGEERDYLNGKQDIHEASLSLQERVREVYLDQARRDETFRVIGCGDEQGNMLPAETIFGRIYDEIF